MLQTRFSAHMYVCEMIVHEPSVIVYALSLCVLCSDNEQALCTRVLQLLLADSVHVSCLSCLVQCSVLLAVSILCISCVLYSIIIQ